MFIEEIYKEMVAEKGATPARPPAGRNQNRTQTNQKGTGQ
jgi:hypothetical protein